MTTGRRRRWRGLSVEEGRLWLRASRQRGERLRLEPDRLIVVGQRSEQPLDWSSGFLTGPAGADGWWSYGVQASRYNRAAVVVVRAPIPSFKPQAPYDLNGATAWTIPAAWLSLGFVVEELPALLHFLAATPAARARLNDESRLEVLLEALSNQPSFDRRVPGEPLMGDALDLHLAVERVLDRIWTRRFLGRPVRNEPLPHAADVVVPVQNELPPWVRRRMSDAAILARIERHLSVRPWPFDCLLTPAT